MKLFIGKVVSLKQQKTATVLVERMKVHPLYKKRYFRSTNYHVQDDLGVKVGDTVKFSDCRPCSKTKKWKILEVVTERGKK